MFRRKLSHFKLNCCQTFHYFEKNVLYQIWTLQGTLNKTALKFSFIVFLEKREIVQLVYIYLTNKFFVFGLDFCLFWGHLLEYRQITWHFNLLYLPPLLDSKIPAWGRSWIITQIFVILTLLKLFHGRMNRFITKTNKMSELTSPCGKVSTCFFLDPLTLS